MQATVTHIILQTFVLLRKRDSKEYETLIVIDKSIDDEFL